MDVDVARPASDADRDGWKAYWTAQGMPWRQLPEIDDKRQAYLRTRLTVRPDVAQGIYPFHDEHGSIRLSRADVEWLLANHHDGRWRAEWGRTQPGLRRQGLDLRGADLREVDLQRLPLMQLRAGLDADNWVAASPTQREASAVHLEGANLHFAFLQDAGLRGANLESANLESTHLEGAMLRSARMGSRSAQATIADARHLTELRPTTLRFAHLDPETNLREVTLGDAQRGFVQLADMHWNGADVSRIPWRNLSITGDEQAARSPIAHGKRKSRQRRLDDYLIAARSYRQLATVLRSQGLTEDADKYAYRAQLMHRVVQRRSRHYHTYLGSLFIDLLAGYGFRPERSLLVYLAVILWFANFYVWASHGLFSLGLPPTHVQPLAWYEGLILSVSSFHGRGFQPFQNLNDPIAALAGMQAVFGLIIEVSFIATFTQRFFAR